LLTFRTLDIGSIQPPRRRSVRTRFPVQEVVHFQVTRSGALWVTGDTAAMAAANSVSRVTSARFWCGCVNAKHPHDVTCAGAGCRERQCLFCLLASAGSAGRCRKSISRRQPLPASAAVRAVRLLPAANAFRPAHRLPPTPQFSCRGGMVRCGCQRSIAYRRASRIASIVGAVKRPTGPCNS
jgi:hypothetical protein